VCERVILISSGELIGDNYSGSLNLFRNGARVSVFVFSIEEPTEASGKSLYEFIGGFGVES
jgi:hypothetical protein